MALAGPMNGLVSGFVDNTVGIDATGCGGAVDGREMEVADVPAVYHEM